MNSLSKEERNKLIIDHMGKAQIVCKVYCHMYPQLDYKELCSIAYLAMTKAAHYHCIDKGSSFWCYAEVVIRRKIKAHLEQVGRYVCISWL